VIDVIGEPNRPATIKNVTHAGSSNTNSKAGDVPADDVQELLSLVSQLRGFPSHPSKDICEYDR